MQDSPSGREQLIASVGEERERLLGQLMESHRARLLRMVRLRMHPHVRSRVDASDVIQETYIEAQRQIEAYVKNPRLPFFLWLRRLAGDRVMRAHRAHLDAQKRDPRRERADRYALPDVSVPALTELISASQTTPTQGAARAELARRVKTLVNALSPLDREIVSLRHFEHLSNNEAAEELGISPQAASNRYVRALKRMSEALHEGDRSEDT